MHNNNNKHKNNNNGTEINNNLNRAHKYYIICTITIFGAGQNNIAAKNILGK